MGEAIISCHRSLSALLHKWHPFSFTPTPFPCWLCLECGERGEAGIRAARSDGEQYGNRRWRRRPTKTQREPARRYSIPENRDGNRNFASFPPDPSLCRDVVAVNVVFAYSWGFPGVLLRGFISPAHPAAISKGHQTPNLPKRNSLRRERNRTMQPLGAPDGRFTERDLGKSGTRKKDDQKTEDEQNGGLIQGGPSRCKAPGIGLSML